ncbi:uncharacterized protein LOC107370446 [Tetranychus urticae]|nr:uncharacterized protein LOC107370446 [Tetranychus urticae]
MLSTGSISINISGIYENVKQLHLDMSNLYLCELAHYFPNLERLHFYMKPGLSEPYSNAPVLANLKIIEMGMSHGYWEDGRCSFVFMDSCPALQSAHIRFNNSSVEVNFSVKLVNLQDLVIEIHHSIELNDLRRLMSKYPNLKHLALRNFSLKDEHIKQLILILPKLTLLDIRKSYGVTQEAADHVRDYCKRYGRSIKIYFKKDDEQLETDWPEKICRGFDFMRHCFFNSFDDLPYFLDPIDD